MRRIWILMLLVIPMVCTAQKEATNWYFGENAGISFANGTPQALLDGALHSIEGNATISDPLTGELLFYTDGETVWNREHTIMPNGSDLAGSFSSTQSALIVPAPTVKNIYYIFTTGQVSQPPSTWMPEMRYSVVDMTADLGLGAIRQKNIKLLDSTAEKQSATLHCNGEDFWVVTHHMTRNEFYAFHVTKNGVNLEPVISTVGKEPTGTNAYGAGQLKISPNGRMIAVMSTFNNAFFNALQLFDFDNATGIVSNARLISNGRAYSAAFSPDNSKLYLKEDRSRALLQYDLSIPVEDSIQASEVRIFTGPELGITPLQIGPDGKIYVGMRSALGVIHQPNQKGLACDFRSRELPLEGRISIYGLPNFIDFWFNESAIEPFCIPPISAFEVEDTLLCQFDSLVAQDLSTRNPSSWLWTFEGGVPAQFEGETPPPVQYRRPGEYFIILETRNSRGSHRDSLKITVSRSPVVNAGRDIRLCRGEQTELTASGADSYQWSPAAGLSDATIANPMAKPTSTTTYVVTGTNEFGCTDRDSVLVRVIEPAPAVVSGDTSVCAGATIRLQASGGSAYQWTPQTYLDDPLSPTPLLNAPAEAIDETIIYTVRVTNGECSSTASMSVRITAIPMADAGPDTATCAGATIRLRASGGSVYQWTPQTYLDDPLSPTPLLTPLPNASGQTLRYTVQTMNGACVSTASVNVQIRATPAVDAGPDLTICPGARTQLSGAGAGDFLWTPADGLDDPTSPTPFAAPTTTTVYRLTVTDNNGCTAFDETTVTINSTLNLTVRTPAPICAGDSVQLFVEGAESYRWEPAQFFDDPTEQHPWVTLAADQRFTVTGSADGCEGSASIDVEVYPGPVGIVGPDTTICVGQTALLRAGGGATYKWTPTLGLSDPDAAQTEARPLRSTVYSVTITDANGCSVDTDVAVEVLPIAGLSFGVEHASEPAFPDEVRELDIILNGASDELAQAAIDSVALTFKYDAAGLGYEGMQELANTIAPGWIWRSEERPEEDLLVISGSGPPLTNAGTLFAVPLRVFISDHPDLFTEVEIIQAQIFGSGICFKATIRPGGGITLSSYCLSAGRPIEVTGASFGLSAPQPNPAADVVEIRYNVGFAGRAKISVYSALGDLVRTAVDEYKNAGEYAATIHDLPSGAYYCVMESGPFRAAQAFSVLR